MKGTLFLALAIILALPCESSARESIRVASKNFTENIILGEIIAQIAEDAGEADVERNLGLGSAAVAYAALQSGEIDIYPEYTGTISQTLINDVSADDAAKLRDYFADSAVTVSGPIGFSNTSALAITSSLSTRLSLNTLSELRQHPELTAAFGGGYLDRSDGWPGLSAHYGLRLADIRVIEHALKYDAVAQGEIDLIDIYSTDGKLQRYDLKILEDDRKFFPDYEAILFVRKDFIAEFPETWKRLNDLLVGRIDNDRMSTLNAMADLDGHSPEAVAESFLSDSAPVAGRPGKAWDSVGKHAIDHLYLVIVSVGLAVLVGIPVGVLAARSKTMGTAALMSVEVVQTIPSLALLVFMIPLLGIGQSPALVALFLYALLPIVRNTYTGMIGIDRQLLEMAGVLGLNRWQTLGRIELPLASLSIMAGVKTSAVVTVGTATLAAFIGGGGLGTLIVRGLALNDTALILAGAIPSALLALAIHGGFVLLDRVLIPRGLRKYL